MPGELDALLMCRVSLMVVGRDYRVTRLRSSAPRMLVRNRNESVVSPNPQTSVELTPLIWTQRDNLQTARRWSCDLSAVAVDGNAQAARTDIVVERHHGLCRSQSCWVGGLAGAYFDTIFNGS